MLRLTLNDGNAIETITDQDIDRICADTRDFDYLGIYEFTERQILMEKAEQELSNLLRLKRKLLSTFRLCSFIGTVTTTCLQYKTMESSEKRLRQYITLESALNFEKLCLLKQTTFMNEENLL